MIARSSPIVARARRDRGRRRPDRRSREDEQGYQVRAIFDNAGFVIPGEDVKIAGVKVGKVASLDVTRGLQGRGRARHHRARLPGLPQRRELHRAPAEPDRRALRRVQADAAALGHRRAAARAGARSTTARARASTCCRSTNTMQTVDIDLIGNTMREPERERLSLILNELGTGVAGRGSDLNEVIRRANPALQETDKVLEILARQNTAARAARGQLGHVLAPLARDRAQVASAIRNSSEVAEATAEKRGALADDIQTLPRVPRRARADDGAARLAGGRDDAACCADLTRSAGDINNVVAPPRAVLAGRDPGRRLARRGGQDRHAGGHRRAARDRRPARAGQGRAAGRHDAARGARVLPRHRRHRAPDGLHLLPSGRDQRLRRGRPLPARRADRQPVRDLRAWSRSRAARRTSRPPTRPRPA